jgi:hypothetical protein
LEGVSRERASRKIASGRSNLFSDGVHNRSEEKEKEVWEIQKAATLLDIDLRKAVELVGRRYGLRLPKRVLMAEYDDKDGDLYIRFDEARSPRGEPTEDGLVLVHREKGRIVGIEILDMAELEAAES